MALYHLSAKIIGRQGGRRAEKRAQSGRVRQSATNAVAAAAYRSGDQLHDERTGSTYRYARAERVMHTEIIAPADAPSWSTDRAKLWNSVEAHERRKDAQLAREIEIALPVELDADQQRELVRRWIAAEFTPAGAVVDFAIHHDRDNRNPHAHVMVTMRSLGPEGWSKQKLRQWEDRSALVNWRASWAEHVNTALERAGREERVDHRSYAEQDADRPVELQREPTLKIGPWARGGDREQENRAIKLRNRERLRRIAEYAKRLAAPVQQAAQAVGSVLTIGDVRGMSLSEIRQRPRPVQSSEPDPQPQPSRPSAPGVFSRVRAFMDERAKTKERQAEEKAERAREQAEENARRREATLDIYRDDFRSFSFKRPMYYPDIVFSSLDHFNAHYDGSGYPPVTDPDMLTALEQDYHKINREKQAERAEQQRLQRLVPTTPLLSKERQAQMSKPAVDRADDWPPLPTRDGMGR